MRMYLYGMEEARPEVAVTYAESASAPERGEGRGGDDTFPSSCDWIKGIFKDVVERCLK